MKNDPLVTNVEADEWSAWLLGRRHGGDTALQRQVLEAAARVGDRVLDGARLEAGMTLVDVGSGDGLIAFRAIARIGGSLRVVLADLSTPLLLHAEGIAIERGVRAQCVFLKTTAERLDGLGDGTADVVTTRAVLAYVANKEAALREFQRVLKPGGRISIAEPILRDAALEVAAIMKAIDSQPVPLEANFLRFLGRLRAAQFPSTEEEIRLSPIANYSERDLVRFAREAGFVEIHLELHIDVRPSFTTTWASFLDISPHPWSPTAGEVLAERFSEEERQLFEQVMRPIIESPHSMTTDIIAYLTAAKPAGAPGP